MVSVWQYNTVQHKKGDSAICDAMHVNYVNKTEKDKYCMISLMYGTLKRGPHRGREEE